MKKLVYLGVLSLGILPLLNCAPKDKQLRQPNTKDPEVAQLEVSQVSGLDYTYYLTTRAKEAKDLLELALSENLQQPKDSCIEVIPQYELNGVEHFKIAGDCSYKIGGMSVDFKVNEQLDITKDKSAVYEVNLFTRGKESWVLKPTDKAIKGQADFTRTERSFTATRVSGTRKSEQVFDVFYEGVIPYEQARIENKLKAYENGTQIFTLTGQFRRSTSGFWSISEPGFELNIKAKRTLINSKKRTEKSTEKIVDVYLLLEQTANQQKDSRPLAFIGDCDRIAGVLNVSNYDHKTTEKGFTGRLEMGESSMTIMKSGARLELPACEKSADGSGYSVQPPLNVIYLK